MIMQGLFNFDDMAESQLHPQEKELPRFEFDVLFDKELPIVEMHNSNTMAIYGDCLEVLRNIKSKTVNLIFADAPYNIGKDFGNNSDKWESVDAYVKWCKTWLDECMRVLTDNGTMYVMTATQHMPYLDIYVSKRYNVLCRIAWTYDSSGVQSKKIYGSLYEPILMLNKSSKFPYTFNYKDILVEAKTGSQRKLIDYRKDPPQPYNTEKVPGNVWNFSRVRFKQKLFWLATYISNIAARVKMDDCILRYCPDCDEFICAKELLTQTKNKLSFIRV